MIRVRIIHQNLKDLIEAAKWIDNNNITVLGTGTDDIYDFPHDAELIMFKMRWSDVATIKEIKPEQPRQ